MESTQNNKTVAIYYPFSRCLDEETLKRAILLYDQILFVDPKTPKVRQGLYSVENHQPYLPDDAARKLTREWEYIEQHYEILTKVGVVSFFDPSPLLERPSIDRLITENLEMDMGDHRIPELFEAYPKSWSILRSRIPKTSFEYLHHQYTPRVLYPQNTLRAFATTPDGRYHALFADGKPEQDYSTPGYGGRVIPELTNEFACVVPYYLGSSLSVSLALAASAHTGAIPFTESNAHHKLLSYRFQRAAATQKEASLEEIPGIHAKEHPVSAQKLHLVELRIIDSILSAEDLEKLSLQEVLLYREHTAKQRQAFRNYLANIAHQIKHDVWSPEIEQEIANEIQKIQKDIDEQKHALRSAYKELFFKAAVGTAINTAPILLNTVFPGVSVVIAFVLGAGTTTGLLAEPIKDLIDLWKSRLGTEKNALTYLLQLHKPK